MKTKLIILTLLSIAAMITEANAGPHGGGFGGGGFHGGGFGGARATAAPRAVGVPSFHAMPMQRFGGGRSTYSTQRFPSATSRQSGTMQFQPHYANSNVSSARSRQFTTGSVGSTERGRHFPNAMNRSTQLRGGNHLRADWHNHVFAQHSAGWHRDWDGNREHWWHGHRCRFINGSWVVFDVGFDPWWPYWWDDPYDYYGYGYPYPYYYDAGDYGDEYYEQNSYAEQSSNSLVATVQQELAREGYYRGQIDGVVGPDTSRAIASYQSSHGVRVTGTLTKETLQMLGLG